MDTKIQESKMASFNTKTHLATVKDLRVNISIHKIINVLLIDIAILWDQQTMYGYRVMQVAQTRHFWL